MFYTKTCKKNFEPRKEVGGRVVLRTNNVVISSYYLNDKPVDLLQIREYVKADCQITGKLPKDALDWGNRLRYLGPWVFTIPLTRLEEYLDNPLNEATLQTVQSPRLSPMQV